MAVFCEYGTSGYCTDHSIVARPVPGDVTLALEKLAKKHNTWLCGGTSELVDGRFANTAVMVSPKEGLVAKYRKIHPFGDERDHLVMGDEPVVVDTELGKVGIIICFDFMFPELARILALQGAEIIVNPTFWFADSFSEKTGFSPSSIMALAQTRALENSVFVAMACRTGEEDAPWGGKVRGLGHSSICSFSGKQLATAGIGEMVITAPLDMEARKKWISAVNYFGCRRPEIYKEHLWQSEK
jgi:predicted amidohydrolase